MSAEPIKLGVLLPRSQIYPAMGANLLAGLRLALAGEGVPPTTLVAAESGFGQSMAEERAKQLLQWEQVDLLIGLLGVNVAAALQPLVEARGCPCIAVNCGENIPRAHELYPLLFQHTLGLWQANYALGQWAAATLGTTALISQSFYDSGYDLPFAFRLGFEHAGGQIAFGLLSHVPPDRGSFDQLFQQAATLRPDLIFASYCGPAASQFVRAYAEAGLADRIPLLGSGMLTDAPLLAEQGAAALGVRTARAWPETPTTSVGHAFAAAYHAQHQQLPDGFAILGFELGLLVAQALAAVHPAQTAPDQLRKALAEAAADGPRGRLAFDPQTRSTAPATIFLREVQLGAAGCSNVEVAELLAPDAADSCFEPARTGLRSGWLNTYLSA